MTLATARALSLFLAIIETMTAVKYPTKSYGGFFLAISALVFFTMPLFVRAEVVISEVMYDPAGSDTQHEYIELHNTGSTPVDIKKWKINDGGNHVLNAPPKNGGVGSAVIAPGGYAVIASDATAFRSKYPGVATVIDASISLKNSDRTISLRDASSTVMSSFTYSNSEAAGDGNSLQLVAGLIVSGPPTPGADNKAGAPPVPVAIHEQTIAPATPAATHAMHPKQNTPKKVKHSSKSSKAKTPLVDAFVAPDAEATATEPVDVVPQGAPMSNTMWWYGGAGALTVAAAGASIFIRKKQNIEWDIEEMADDV